METLIERCAGLDVHKDTVVACVRLPGPGGQRQAETRSFGTTTGQLLELRDWLADQGVTLVGMAWIAQLVENGLVRPSFVPPKPIRELRNLTRYRRSQIDERARESQRLDKILQDAGIKLSSVASRLRGVSSRRILEALVAGQTDGQQLAKLAKGQLRKKLPELEAALQGRFSRHHALIVGEILAKLDYLDELVERLSEEVSRAIAPFAQQVQLLDTIPGVDRRMAEALIAEIGVEMDRFGTSAHLASWAGVCPGQHESAGKSRSGKTRKGGAGVGRPRPASPSPTPSWWRLFTSSTGWSRTRTSGRTGSYGVTRPNSTPASSSANSPRSATT